MRARPFIGVLRLELWALAHDAAGRLWLGTTGGLVVRDRDRFTTSGVADGLPDNAVRALHHDREGRLWVGTNRGITCRVGGRFRTFDGLDRITSTIRAVAEEREGALWMATLGAGVCRYAAGVVANHRAADGLAGDEVASIYQDPDGNIWLGTMQGLARVSGDAVATTFNDGLYRVRDGRIDRHFTTKDGLADNLAFELPDGGRGSLWLLGNRGICRATWQSLNDVADGKASTVSSVAGVADGMLNREGNGGGPSAARLGRRRAGRALLSRQVAE